VMEIIKSSRFQALVLLAIFSALHSAGLLSSTILEASIIILGGHIGIRTLDRASEKIGNTE